MIFDKSLPLFYSKDIYRSLKTGKESTVLSDFNTDHKLNPEFLSFIQNKEYDPLAAQKEKFPAKYKLRLPGTGVSLSSTSNPLSTINIVENVYPVMPVFNGLNLSEISSFTNYKKEIFNVLSDNVLKFKNQRNLLLLSSGVDSQLLLAVFLKNNVPFVAVHITYSAENSAESKWLYHQYEKLNYPLEFELIGNLDLENALVNYAKTNIPTWNAFVDIVIFAAITQKKYKDFDNIFMGGGNHDAMLQNEIYLNQLVSDKNLIKEYNKNFGEYVRYPEDISVYNFLSEKYGEDYTKLMNPLTAVLDFKIFGAYDRAIFRIEDYTSMKAHLPFRDQKILELSLSLTGDAAIKNVYKHTQLEILKSFNMDVLSKKTFASSTFQMPKWRNRYIHDECIKTWINNYLGLPLDTDIKTISS